MSTQTTTHVLKDDESCKNARVVVKMFHNNKYEIRIQGTNTLSNKVSVYNCKTLWKRKPINMAEMYFRKWLKGK
jgi:hypothetical protein